MARRPKIRPAAVMADSSINLVVKIDRIKIKMRTTLAGPIRTVKAGEILEIPFSEAEPLIQGGYAEIIDLNLDYENANSENTDLKQPIETAQLETDE